MYLYYVIAFIVLLLIVFIGAVTYYSFDPKDDFNAMICHSVLNSEDNGHIYCYHIYATDNNHYEYIKTKRTIKKGKNGSIGRVASGKINGEKDYDRAVAVMREFTQTTADCFEEQGDLALKKCQETLKKKNKDLTPWEKENWWI